MRHGKCMRARKQSAKSSAAISNKGAEAKLVTRQLACVIDSDYANYVFNNY